MKFDLAPTIKNPNGMWDEIDKGFEEAFGLTFGEFSYKHSGMDWEDLEDKYLPSTLKKFVEYHYGEQTPLWLKVQMAYMGIKELREYIHQHHYGEVNVELEDIPLQEVAVIWYLLYTLEP